MTYPIIGVTASDIKNQALFELGFPDEIDFTGTDAVVDKVNRVYATCLLGILSSYRWRFATRRMNLLTARTGTFTAVASTDIITATIGVSDGHTCVLTTTETLPAGLALATTYYIVSASGYDAKLSLTSGGAAIDITGAGTGVHTITYTPQVLAGDSDKYKYNYTLPADMLTFNNAYYDSEYSNTIRDYETSQTDFNSDSTTAFIAYGALVDETKFPQYFINYLKYKLASDMCFNLTGDSDLLKYLSLESEKCFIRAKNVDARQNQSRTIKASPFVVIRG